MTTYREQFISLAQQKTNLLETIVASSEGLSVSLTDAGLLQVTLTAASPATTVTTMPLTTAQALWLITQIQRLLVDDVV